MGTMNQKYEALFTPWKIGNVEMKNDLIAVKSVCLANASYLRDFFATNKVPVYLETTLDEVLEDGAIAVDEHGKHFKY